MLTNHSHKNPANKPMRMALAVLALSVYSPAAKAEHMCSYPGSDEVVVAEIIGPGAGYYMCEWVEPESEQTNMDDVKPAPYDMQSFSPEELSALSDYQQGVGALTAQERNLMAQRYEQLKQGMWFLPGETPFEGWMRGSAPATSTVNKERGCTASYWTLDGTVTLSTLGGADGMAVISYRGKTIPVPEESITKKISLTQSGRTQTVPAFISSAKQSGREMGMVSFQVQSGTILVNAIADVQDYSISDDGKTIFSGQWHDGLKARNALAQCLAGK